MNSFPSLFRRSLLLVALLAALGARVGAVTISASFTLPTSDFGNLPTTESNPNIGTFNFSSDPNWGTVTSLGLIDISLRFFNLDTNTGGLDNGNIFLTLGGLNTGLALNGFGNGTDTVSFTGVSPSNASGIIAALNGSGGLLNVGLLDTTSSPTNPFALLGGTASISFVGATVVAVPFTPVQTLGYGLIALAIAWRIARRREWPQLALARLSR